VLFPYHVKNLTSHDQSSSYFILLIVTTYLLINNKKIIDNKINYEKNKNRKESSIYNLLLSYKKPTITSLQNKLLYGNKNNRTKIHTKRKYSINQNFKIIAQFIYFDPLPFLINHCKVVSIFT